ncbi:MAG: glycoside hydrolase family 2 TIM barrel-domain containing protein [Candidatus Latescibacter sp.]|nr:glycoside hydrolase family 2 TIM barrel-domain containing protein [Candidatus Latescibacter sp.]
MAIARKSIVLFLVLLVSGYTLSHAAPGHSEKTLSGVGWQLWLDRSASWTDDEVFLPPIDYSKIPSNPPTCGWERLDAQNGKKVTVPGTVEEYYWSAPGNPVGIAGDYRGVSWWSTKFTLDPALKGKKIFLAFESANLRTEVYVNRKLVGYDVIGNTPFEADATPAAVFGGENRLDVRITDPIGNFSWPAHVTFPWGKYMIPAVHGFGGITGAVTLKAVDTVHVDDIYVLNKPQAKEADVFVMLGNSSGAEKKGTVSLVVHEWKNPSNVVFTKSVSATVPASGKEISLYVKAPKAELWDLLDPHLYVASVTFKGADGAALDTMTRRFGFRWFDISMKDGDYRMYLNGRRIFMMAAVNRGFWPGNGMFPTPEWARKDVEVAIQMGFNTVAFHNAIGHQNLLSACEEAGLLSTGESAGYRCNDDRGKPFMDPVTLAMRRKKLFRFVMRDRSSPSLVAYMLKNEDQNPPDADDMSNMARVRKLDPTRILIYTGDRDRSYPAWQVKPDDPMKLFYKPTDPKGYTYGWFDMHHWNREAGYLDDYYRNPGNYMRLNTVDGDSTHHVRKDEIIFYGEEGAIGTMFRLGKIKEFIDSQGTSDGWREREHLDWFNAYDRFLDESGFRAAFPTVDALTLALGKNMHYFHGRIIENARISNVIDAYNLNGWACEATHTDIVDVYRNPTGDPAIIKYYNQPLYVAVKIRDKVLPRGTAPVADLYIVNEKDLKGNLTLELDMKDPGGNSVFTKSYPVTILGGEEFGQLLVEGVAMPPVAKPGYYKLNARITGSDGVKCTGVDDAFAVDYLSGPGLRGKGAVVDTSGAVNSLLKEARGIILPEFTPQSPKLDYIVVGAHDFGRSTRTLYRLIMEQVKNGATLVVLDHADLWAQQLDDIYAYQAIQYTGSARWGNQGRLFVGKSSLLTDLPTAQSMGWEYQVFYRSDVWGLNMGRIGNETVVALAAQNRKDILTAVSRIPFGDGRIILSTLSLVPELKSKRPQSAIAKKLFLNFLEYNDK